MLFESPAVKTCELAISIVPEPSIDKTVSLASTLYCPLEPTLTAVLSDKDPETFRTPPLMAVVPV